MNESSPCDHLALGVPNGGIGLVGTPDAEVCERARASERMNERKNEKNGRKRVDERIERMKRSGERIETKIKDRE